MVRIASSLIGAAVAISYASAAPAVLKRQDIVPVAPVEGLNTVDPNAIPTGVDINGSLGQSVAFPTETTVPPPVETTMPPVQTMPPVFETMPPQQPPAHTSMFPQYGSGSVTWHGGYNDCVQTCFASHPLPATVVTIPPHMGQGQVVNQPGQAPVGNMNEPTPAVGGAMHEILVEPSAGSVRFVPAFTNAAVGDVVRFSVINGQHSITQSSALSPCNATAGGFDSGAQIAGGTFSFQVQSTDPTFFFSTVGTDCQAGLFGAINAATGLEDSPTTVNSLLPKLAEQDADVRAALDATNALAAQTPGLNWGGRIETSGIAPELTTQLVNNVLFTRTVMGHNPEMVDTSGNFNPTSEVVIPADRARLLAVANQGGFPQEVLNDPGAAATPETESAPDAAQNVAYGGGASTDGAGSIISSASAVALAVAASVFFL